MAYELPPLSYGFDALEPHPELAKKSVEDLLRGISSVPEDVRNVLRNNAGGHSNHSIFWTIMGPGGVAAPSGRIGDAINSTFGSYDAFKEQLTKAAVGQFGSGWRSLIADSSGKRPSKGYPTQDSPYLGGMTPILGVDVWAHADYLRYRSQRPD